MKGQFLLVFRGWKGISGTLGEVRAKCESGGVIDESAWIIVAPQLTESSLGGIGRRFC